MVRELLSAVFNPHKCIFIPSVAARGYSSIQSTPMLETAQRGAHWAQVNTYIHDASSGKLASYLLIFSRLALCSNLQNRRLTPRVTPASKVLTLPSRTANQSPDPERKKQRDVQRGLLHIHAHNPHSIQFAAVRNCI